jgi:hypothetical protein
LEFLLPISKNIKVYEKKLFIPMSIDKPCHYGIGSETGVFA